MALQRDTRPLSLQVSDEILKILEEEGYGEGDQLPSEQELASHLGVSRPTVREALKLLEERQVLYCRHGRGRFLTLDHSLIQESIARLQSVTEMLEECSIVAQAKVVSLREEPAGESVAQQLGIEASDPVILLERIRLANEEPLIYSLDVFPRNIVKGPLDAVELRGSLLQIMEERWGVRIAYSRAAIRAVHLEAETTQRMGLPPDLPWIMMEQVNYTAQHRPVVFSKDYHRGDKFTFYILRRRY
jgi:GntR family transcriptional regulator